MARVRGLGVLAFTMALGSLAPQGVASEGPWGLWYLLTADPNEVTLAQLVEHAQALETKFQNYHQFNGTVFRARWDEDPGGPAPTSFDTGGDSAIWTGHYLAAAVYRFLVTQTPEDFAPIRETLRGLYLLTHVSGVPGVLVRCAFPKDQAQRWHYPQWWEGRIKEGHVYHSPSALLDPFHPNEPFPEMIFYTTTTRDQLTGVLLGLSVFWHELTPEVVPWATSEITELRHLAATIIEDIYARLRNTDFVIRDHQNKTGTTAAKVDGLIYLQLISLYKEMVCEMSDARRCKRYSDKYKDAFNGQFWLDRGSIADVFNPTNNIKSYYAFNLRYGRAFSVFLMEPGKRRRQKINAYLARHVWKYIESHQNTYFIFLTNIIRQALGEYPKKLDQAVYSLKALYLRPTRSWPSPLLGKERYPSKWQLLFEDVSAYVIPVHLREPTQHFIWQKDPFKVGQVPEEPGLQEATGVDFLLPYWLGRYYGFISGTD